MGDNIAKRLVEYQVLSLKPQLTKLSSGIKSPIYCYVKLLQSIVDGREYVISHLIERINKYDKKPQMIAGVVSGAIPFSMLIADRMKLPHLSVKKTAKLYGKKNTIDGKVEEGKNILLLEDVVTTGKSSAEAIKTIRAEGGLVDKCLTIVSYNTNASEKAFKEIGCELDYLTTIDKMIYEHLRTNQPAKKVVKKVEAFVKKYIPSHADKIISIFSHFGLK